MVPVRVQAKNRRIVKTQGVHTLGKIARKCWENFVFFPQNFPFGGKNGRIIAHFEGKKCVFFRKIHFPMQLGVHVLMK